RARAAGRAPECAETAAPRARARPAHAREAPPRLWKSGSPASPRLRPGHCTTAPGVRVMLRSAEAKGATANATSHQRGPVAVDRGEPGELRAARRQQGDL